VSLGRPSLPLLFASAALVLVPWIGLIVVSLPSHYSARHWGIAWAGFDAGLALTLGLTAYAAFGEPLARPRRDRGENLLIAGAWFDVVTARSTGAIALAMTEALGIELPLALLCIWVAQTSRSRQPLTTAHTDQQGALQ
jgi:hypothetical protein